MRRVSSGVISALVTPRTPAVPKSRPAMSGESSMVWSRSMHGSAVSGAPVVPKNGEAPRKHGRHGIFPIIQYGLLFLLAHRGQDGFDSRKTDGGSSGSGHRGPQGARARTIGIRLRG